MGNHDMANSAGGTEAGPETAPLQETGAEDVPAALLLLVERRLQAPLSPLLRGKLMERLSAGAQAWTAETIALVPDGIEPATIFRALALHTGEERDAAH